MCCCIVQNVMVKQSSLFTFLSVLIYVVNINLTNRES